MDLNITELLQHEVKIDPQHICLNITTITDIYNLCFIEYEDHNKLGVYITGEDGRERYLILNKNHIIALQVVYEQDINLQNTNHDTDIMVI